ncbi:LysR family transcriptional regulator [Proteus mirabilis]|uniref:LysR family transcriptional regulator n=1 Tax=Proteus mirabilis TaxID=584 RepID=UPI000F5BD131|nr:LysR family transcriptional regulator [Proteus mirabilis]MBS3827252.1 LysR family transcriptional regulator [Proteus mirabilis]MBS3838065.1 LysR family transcriptional regulator [Proteus mirabilis]MDC9788167.1 LysR family transcriptional regulator [Proteus mirabilis]RQW15924.1 LysR family transcriptional regulator [Proteus mirabilis]
MTSIVKRASWSGGWATLRDLEIIQTVIDTGSVTVAAEQLGISQPAVSRTLNQIEERCGRKLFNRESNRLTPNADALLLYEEIGQISASFNRLSQFQPRERKRQLRILVPPTIGYGFLNQITAQFMQKNPQLHVYLEIVRSEQLLQMIAKDEADIAVADAITENYHYNFNQVPIRNTGIICALPKNHNLCKKTEISPEDLHRQPFIALIKHNIGRKLMDRALNKAGAKPEQIAEVSDLETALTFVQAGLGISLVSAFPLIQSEDIEYRPFSANLHSVISCFTQKKIDSDVQSYIEFIKKHQPKADKFSSPV